MRHGLDLFVFISITHSSRRRQWNPEWIQPQADQALGPLDWRSTCRVKYVAHSWDQPRLRKQSPTMK